METFDNRTDNPRQLPVVAVIIPLHNHAEYVARAIESATAQDYPAKFVVIIDDGSTDDSFKVVYELLGGQDGILNNTRVFLLHNDVASGPSAARNIAIKFAWEQAHLFSMLDADDYYLQGKISRSVIPFIEYPEMVGLTYTDAIIENLQVGTRVEEFREPYSRRRLEQECIISNTPLISKLAFRSCGLYEESMRTCEDFMLYIKITERFLAVHIPERLHVYSVTGVNASDMVNKEVWQQNWAKIGQYLQSRRNQ